MPDPMVRRFEASATVYFEVEPDGLSLARVVIDVPLPDPSVLVANLPSRFDLDVSRPLEGGRVSGVRGFGVARGQADDSGDVPASWEVAG